MELIRNPLALVVLALLFVPLERLFALRPQRLFRAGWRTDVAHFFVSHVIHQLVLVLCIGAALAVIDPLVSRPLQEAVAAQPHALQFAEALLLVELIGYAMHRAFHRVPWLWRIHAVHHSSEHLDWLAALRVHPLDQALTRTAQFAPLYLLGFSAQTFAGLALIVGLWAIFLHANVRLRFGPLKWLIATPEFHHWHHSSDAEGVDTNFSGLFPLVDALFGTLHLPRRWPAGYGVAGERVPATWWAQLVYPLSRATPSPATGSDAAPRAPAR